MLLVWLFHRHNVLKTIVTNIFADNTKLISLNSTFLLVSKKPQQTLGWHSIGTRSTLHRHLGLHSINTPSTSQLTVGQQSTNFHRHTIKFQSINMRLLRLCQLLTSCRSSTDWVWSRCQSSAIVVMTKHRLRCQPRYKPGISWLQWSVNQESIDWHSTKDALSTPDPIFF